MKIYLAAKYCDKPYIRLVRDKLEASGHIVTSRWLDETENPSIQIDEVDDATLRGYAEQDLEDIDATDCLILFQQKGSPNLRGGAIVERGIATGKGKLIGIVGDRINVFDFMEDVMVFDTLEAFFGWAAINVCPVEGDTQDGWLCRDGERRDYLPEEFNRPLVEGGPEITSDTAKCWCGQELTVVGEPDFGGDTEMVTMHYECGVHGQHHMEPRGIAISGKARSGKNCIGEKLSELLGWPTSALADDLKREWFAATFPVVYATNDTDDVIEEVDRLKVEDPTVRPSLIEYGQWRRGQDQDYWIKKLNFDKKQIVTDLRFENEAILMAKKGFMLIRVECSDEILTKRGCPPIDDPSEKELDKYEHFNHTIHNNGSEDELLKQAEQIACRVER